MTNSETTTTDTPIISDVPGPSSSSVFIADDSQIEKALQEAEELKQEGNDHFRASRWTEALVAYRSALGRLPKRRSSQASSANSSKPKDNPDEDISPPVEDSSKTETDQTATSYVTEYTPQELECAKTRSILNANLAACHMKLNEYQEVVTACTEAIRDDPMYVKALQRRATANEKLDTWSSLSSAQEDYTKLLTLLPSTSPSYIETRRQLNALKPRVEAAQKRETSEMLDKLKGIGNSILGNFGLSTDNFQFTPNDQGGYSMQFAR